MSSRYFVWDLRAPSLHSPAVGTTAFLLWAAWAAAAATPAPEVPLQMNTGAARLVDAPAVRRAISSDPKVVEATITGPDEVLLFAHSAGDARVIALLPGSVQKVFHVTVGAPAAEAPMVSADVQVLEINENEVLNAGVDWALLFQGSGQAASSAASAAGSAGQPVGSAPVAQSPLNVIEVNPSLIKWGQFVRGGVDAVLDFLITRGHAKLLAKPRLLTISGAKAHFDSGGQIPIPVSQPGAQGQSVTIEWKQYGVSLDLEPKIETGETIRLKIRTEVSSIDRANSVAFAGGSVPGVRNRSAEATVLLPSGSTVVMAGLVESDTSKVTVGVPLISEIPLLGELFRHTENQETTTELVIFVTPSLVKP